MKKNRIWIACLIILLCILTGSLLYFFYFNTTTFPKQTYFHINDKQYHPFF